MLAPPSLFMFILTVPTHPGNLDPEIHYRLTVSMLPRPAGQTFPGLIGGGKGQQDHEPGTRLDSSGSDFIEWLVIHITNGQPRDALGLAVLTVAPGISTPSRSNRGYSVPGRDRHVPRR